jgi:3-phosphoshikimate 1-carboxyvinyltransferase
LGVEVRCAERENFPPVRIDSRGIKGGKVILTGKESSQYLSSLLLAAPYAQKNIEIEVEGELVSRPYVDLTLEVMEQFGITVFREGYRTFKVPAGRGYQPCRVAVEGDVSSASYFWAAAAVTGGTITTEPIRAQITRQGDIAFLDLLEKMGCRVAKEAGRVAVQGKTLRGIEADMSSMPDMVPTLAALALFAEGKTVIRNVSHLRLKESDRLHGLWQEWTRLGALIEEHPDGLIITGNVPLRGTCLDPHDDHRLAMSLAVVGLKVPGLQISDESCVQKSFPRFWELWEEL